MISKRVAELFNNYTVFKELSWTFVAQTIGNLMRFLLVFVVIRAYTQEEFGLWASITSLASVIVTGDFGLTNVLRNIASEGISKGEEGDRITKEAWLSAVYSLLAFSIIGILVLYFLSDYPVFENLFKTDNQQLKSMGNGIVIFVLGIFFVSMPFGITNGLFLSYGEVKEMSIFSMISGLLTFAVVASMSLFHLRIDVVSVSFFICPLIVTIISTVFFVKKRKWHTLYIPLRTIFKYMSEMIAPGLKFMGIGISRQMIPNVLTIFSGAMLGLSVAANINVAEKIYTFFMGISTGLLNPIWARLSRSFYSNEYTKCKQMLRLSLLGTAGFAIIIILISTLFRDILVGIIAGGSYRADALIFVLVGGCLWGSTIFHNASLLLVATNRLNVLLTIYLFFSALTLSLFPMIVTQYGFNCMMLTMITCWIFFVLLVLIYTTKVLDGYSKKMC